MTRLLINTGFDTIALWVKSNEVSKMSDKLFEVNGIEFELNSAKIIDIEHTEWD